MKTLDFVSAEGFKSIGEGAILLEDLNVLIGANGAGKSNFLGLFKLLNQIGEGNLRVNGVAEALLRFGSKTTRYVTVELLFSEGGGVYKCTLGPTADDRLELLDDKYFRRPLTNTGTDEAADLEHPVEPIRKHFRSWRVHHFNDTGVLRSDNHCDVDDSRVLQPDGANLASVLLRLKQRHAAEYANIVDAIRMVFPFFGDFTLTPLEPSRRTIKLEWREKGSDSYFNASALSDGTLRFMCLSTLLLQPKVPSLLLLDEPELGLHPYAINIVAELLRSAAKRTQVIVSTQSAGLVNQFEPEDIIVVEREERQSVFRHLDKSDMESWLDDYGLGDLWEKNLLGGRP
jgi:predicted ATPase